MKLYLQVTTEDGKIIFSHAMNYINGKLKFIPGGGYIKTAIKNYLKGEKLP